MTTDREHREPERRTDATTEPASQPAEGETRRKASRRAILGGLAAAPIVTTLANRPAFAKRCTASAAASISVESSLETLAMTCGGYNQDYWKRFGQSSELDRRFSDVFGANWQADFGVTAKSYDPWSEGPTLREVLNMKEWEDRDGFGARAVTAYLNAADPRVGYSMRTDDIQNMVRPILQNRGFNPMGPGGPVWDRGQVNSFLQSTFDRT